MSDIKAENKNDNSVDAVSKTQSKDEKPTPAKNKRTATKRLSTLERTAQESEAFMKGMNTSVGEVEGRRRTRSSARGLTPSKPMPSPTKKPKHETSTKPSGRGRGRPKRQEKPCDNNTDEETLNNKTDKIVDKETRKMEIDDDVKEEEEEDEEEEDEEDDEDDETEEEDKLVVATEKKKKSEKESKGFSEIKEYMSEETSGNKDSKGSKEDKENRENKDGKPVIVENASATNSTKEDKPMEASEKLVAETKNKPMNDDKKSDGKDDDDVDDAAADNNENVKACSDSSQSVIDGSTVQNSTNVTATDASNQNSKAIIDEKRE